MPPRSPPRPWQDQAFAGGADQHDDMTLVVLRVKA
jgi:hypothetical protein